jgi:hypothetical protein
MKPRDNVFCDCGKGSCVLKSRSVWDKYEDEAILNHKMGIKKEKCPCCNPRTEHSRENYFTVDVVELDFKINSSKCELVKKLLKFRFHTMDALTANDKAYKKLAKCEKAFDNETARNLKLKELVKKNLFEIQELNAEIAKLKDIAKGRTRSIRNLKKQFKKLKLCIVDSDAESDAEAEDMEAEDMEANMEANMEADEESDTEADDTKADEEPDTEADDTKADNTNHQFEVIGRYQQIKNFMVKRSLSLSALCYRNNIVGDAKNEIYEKFIRLKLKRLDLCHPYVPDLENDELFINSISALSL